MEKSFIKLYENSIKQNWEFPAFTDYKGQTFYYKDVARRIEKIHIIFERTGIEKGDKIALIGRNSSNWAVSFLAIATSVSYTHLTLPTIYSV